MSEIPDSVFETLACSDTFYFSKDFLEAFEKGNSDIHCDYVLLLEETTPVALLVFQSVQLRLDTAKEQLSFSARVAHSVQCYLNNRKKGLLLLGNIFLSGAYGVFVSTPSDTYTIYAQVPEILEYLNQKRKASVFMIKDMEISHSLEQAYETFQEVAVAPNMVLDVIWSDFETYKNALKSKYRVKINRADTLSKSLQIRSLTADEILEQAPQLQQLYQNVLDNATYTAGILNVETYGLLKQRFRDPDSYRDVYLNTYARNDKIIGFSTAFHVGDRLDAHFIGMDYSCSKEVGLYPRMLNDYVRLGISLGVKQINFGRTASEIKSTLGAVPEALVCYVKHRQILANVFFKPLARQITMTDFKQHTPFKK